MAVEYYDFGPHKIHHSSVFHTTDLSFAFVNLRPSVPGMLFLYVFNSLRIMLYIYLQYSKWHNNFFSTILFGSVVKILIICMHRREERLGVFSLRQYFYKLFMFSFSEIVIKLQFYFHSIVVSTTNI